MAVIIAQPVFTCSKLTIETLIEKKETLEQGLKYVKS